MALTSYRDAIDYLAYYREIYGSMIDEPGSQSTLGKRVMNERSRKIKGVRINCVGDVAGDPSRHFVAVNVPRTHPFFMLEGDDPLDVANNFGESWAVYRYAGYKNPSAPEAQNGVSEWLQLAISEDYLESKDFGKVPEWRKPATTSSVLHVSPTNEDLDVRKVKVVVEQISRNLKAPQTSGYGYEDRKAILDAMMPEDLEEYILNDGVQD
jgi:hypothetical protein